MKLSVVSVTLIAAMALAAVSSAAEQRRFRPEENPFSPYDYLPPPPGPGIARGPAIAPTYDPRPLCVSCGYDPIEPRAFTEERTQPRRALPMPEVAPPRSPSTEPPTGLLQSHDAFVWGGH